MGGFTRDPTLDKQMHIEQLKSSIMAMTRRVHDLVGASYQRADSTAGSSAQVYAFIGGKLSSDNPAAAVNSFKRSYRGAYSVHSGMPGEAACSAAPATSGISVVQCVWYDDYTFGEFVSPNMTSAQLASVMTRARPQFEQS